MPAWIERALQDLRYALRGLRRNPGFTLTAVLAAAIAIGASTAIFSAVDRILFRPLPYRGEARLVSAGMMTPLDSNEFLLADAYFDLRRNPGPFAAVTSFQAGAIEGDLTEQSPLRMRCLRLEANFLDTLGVRLAAGRNFAAEEDRPNGPRVAIISHALWRSRFAADPAAIGKTLCIDGTPTRVAGVLPPDFVMPTLTHADILLPEALDEARERSGRALRVFARLKPGVTLPQAQSRLQPYFARMLETVPPRFRQEVAPEGLPRIEEATVDQRVVLFSAAAAVLSGILFGLFPALRRTEGAVLGSARTVGPARGWLRGALVTAQIAISVTLLTGAGLLLRSLDNLERLPMGFESDRIITASFVLGRQRYSRDVAQLALFRELEQRLETLPGVSAAAVSDSIPPFGGTRGRPLSTIDVEGRPQRPEGSGGMVAWRYVTPGYFAAMGIPLRRGRPFSQLDRGAAQRNPHG